MEHSAWQTVMGILLLCIVALISWQAGTLVIVHNQAAEADKARPVVVIDTEHGDSDPSKVGINGQLEENINLKILEQLKAYLEASDVEVVLTRGSDQGSYSSRDSHKEMTDMRKRREIINEATPDLVVGIHQGSYHEEYVSGGQAFHYKASEKGEFLAEILQKHFNCMLGEVNKGMAKTNDNCYLLLHTKEPIAIVEYGFLSNGRGAERLEDEEYQDRMARTIHMGIMEYLNTVKQKH